MKMKKGNAGVVVLITLLFVIVIAMAGYILYDHMNENKNVDDIGNNVVDNNNNNKPALNEQKEIVLNNNEKARINEELLDKFHNLFISITNLNMDGVKLEDLTYNVSLLDDEKIQYKIVWNSLIVDEEFRNHLTIDKDLGGASTIEFSKVQEAYKKFLNKNVNEKTLLEVDNYTDSHITNGIYHAAVPTGGFGDMNYCIKANKLELNEKTGVYTLITDIVLKTGGNIENSDVLSWDNSLNKANLVIQYTNDNNSKTLVSLVLKRI